MVEDTQKRYADDITLQELVRLRVENERLRKALEEKVTAQLLEYIEDMRRNFSENARLREALKPFAEIADDWDHLDDEDYVSVHKYDIELRHFRAIRSALQQKETE